MKLLSIIGVLLTVFTFNVAQAAEVNNTSIQKNLALEYLEKINKPCLLKTYDTSNPLSKSQSTYRKKLIMLNRSEDNIKVDANGKVTEFLIMEAEILGVYGDLEFNSNVNNDLYIKVYPDGRFGGFKTLRDGSLKVMDLMNTWRKIGTEIDFNKLEAQPKYVKNRVKLLPKALKEAQDTVDFRKKLKADL